jgi:Rrf2 family protein
MKLSLPSFYAVQALVRLAGNNPVALVASHYLATDCKATPRVLRNLLRLLVRVGVVHSDRGSDGGYRLGRPANRITLLDVVEAIDGSLVGEAPPVISQAGMALNAGLQAICEEMTALTRAALTKVLISDLVAGSLAKPKGRRGK